MSQIGSTSPLRGVPRTTAPVHRASPDDPFVDTTFQGWLTEAFERLCDDGRDVVLYDPPGESAGSACAWYGSTRTDPSSRR